MEQLEQVKKSYDEAIDLGRRGIDPYCNLKEEIRNHPYYSMFLEMRENNNLSDSARKEIKEFLSPIKGMNFVDLGCCLNLMFRGYSEWESLYHGLDISPKTIELLNQYVKKQHTTVGSLDCGSIHKTPYLSDFFDIGSCIGVLEYFEQEFVKEAIQEFFRIMKNKARFVLDIPDTGSKECEICAEIEKSLGREDQFNLSKQEFEQLLEPYFIIERYEKVGPMIEYFLICKKD